MAHYIIKLTRGDKSWYLVWSTIVDAPITYGMKLDAFKRRHLSSDIAKNFEARMALVEKIGVDHEEYKSMDGILSGNRAGPAETCLTKDEIIDDYCIKEV